MAIHSLHHLLRAAVAALTAAALPIALTAQTPSTTTTEPIRVGRAEGCATWAAPACAFWPKGRAARRANDAGIAHDAAHGDDGRPPVPNVTLRIAAGRVEGGASRAARAVADQLSAAGFDVAARADIRVQTTHGMPYCPHRSLVAKFGARPERGEARGSDPELVRLVEQAAVEPDEIARLPVYAAIQDRLDEMAIIMPLYVPWRVALRRVDVDGIGLGPDVYRVDLTGLRRERER